MPALESVSKPFPEGNNNGLLPQILHRRGSARGRLGDRHQHGHGLRRRRRGPFKDVDGVPFGATSSRFGIVPESFEADVFSGAYPFGEPVRQAGAHPFELRFNFDINEKTGIGPNEAAVGKPPIHSRYITGAGFLRTAEGTLPRGMIGNPEATPKCDPVDFARLKRNASLPSCPADTQVGYVNARLVESAFNFGRDGSANTELSYIPLYNLQPPRGVPADLGFNILGAVQGHIYSVLDPAQNYAIKSVVPDISAAGPVQGAK